MKNDVRIHDKAQETGGENTKNGLIRGVKSQWLSPALACNSHTTIQARARPLPLPLSLPVRWEEPQGKQGGIGCGDSPAGMLSSHCLISRVREANKGARNNRKVLRLSISHALSPLSDHKTVVRVQIKARESRECAKISVNVSPGGRVRILLGTRGGG